MSLTITRSDRDALYDSLLVSLSAIGDIHTDLQNGNPVPAKRLWQRLEAEIRLLDDLGWEREPEQQANFELTMPPAELRPIIERIYWTAMGSLAEDHPAGELDETAADLLRTATSSCPDILARLTEGDPAYEGDEAVRVPTRPGRE